MALLDFLDKDRRAARKVDTAIKKLTNPYRQSEDRMQAAEHLAAVGAGGGEAAEAAIYGLLKRFTIRASNQVVDEDEKAQVYALVVDLGQAAVPSLRRFIQREDQLRHPLRALAEIEPRDAVVRHVGEALAAVGPDYVKNPESKLHLVQHLAELRHDLAPSYLTPFVADHDESVRFQVVQALARFPGAAARDALMARLAGEEEETLRTIVALCQSLADVDPEAVVPEDRRDAVRAILPDGWCLDEEGRLKKAG